MRTDFRADLLKISKICSGDLVCGDPHRIIETVTTDSRNLGVKNIFIPLVGEMYDGHDFIKELSEGGKIDCFLAMKDGYMRYGEENNIGAIKCGDTLKALGDIAEYHRDSIGPRLIAITGTNGKTTVKEMIYSLLNCKYKCLKNEKNFNNEIGVPFTLLGLNKGHETAVIELGMNHAGEIERLSNMSKPEVSVITNIGEGHLEFLGTLENVAHAKSEIMSGMKTGSVVIINRETECFNILERKAENLNLIIKSYGISKEADIHPEEFTLTGDKIQIKYRGIILSVPLYGIHNVFNIMAAIAVAEEFNVDLGSVKKAFASFKNVSGRSEVIDRGYVVVNDTYNSNPLSSRYALMSIKLIFPNRRKIAVLSDMKELGENAGQLHYNTGIEVYENNFDKLLTWGEMSEKYVEGAVNSGMKKENAVIFDNKKNMIDFLSESITENDLVLVKGSRSMKMEDVVNALIN